MKESMRIISFEAENIKRLKAIQIEPKADVVEIGGKNEAGKSSVLDTIMYILGGKEVIGTEPLRQGTDKGFGKLDLGRFIVTRRFTKNNNAVQVESKEGAVYKTPQALLDGFLSDVTFDPLIFASAKSDVQRDMLLAVSKIPFVAEELEKVSGVKVVADNPLACCSAAQSVIYNKRRDVGRDVTRLTGAVDSIKIPEGMEEAEPVNVAGLFEKRKILEQQATANEAERDKVEFLKDQHADLDEASAAKESKISDLDKEILYLQERILKFQKEKSGALKRLSDINGSIQLVEKKIDMQKETVAQLIDPTFEEIDQLIASADSANEVAGQVKKKKDTKIELDSAQSQYDGFTVRLTAIDEFRKELLQKTVFPLNGLSFDEGQNVTLEGVPISQRGTSKQLIVGLEICNVQDPELRIILMRDANDLDSDNRELIKKWCAENDFQVWQELVQDEPGKVAFYIEEGELKM